ncbi:C-type mannose receptor 2-like isoform 2-T2 [Odontesthes bonariensis]
MQERKIEILLHAEMCRTSGRNMSHLGIWLIAAGFLSKGCVTFCSSSDVIREYHLINEAKNWTESQRYCREKYNDLATIGSHDDVKTLGNLTAASGVTGDIWFGLRKTGPPSWLWTVGEGQASQGLVGWSNWAELPNSTHHCGKMGVDGKWIGESCATTAPFACQKEVGSVWLYSHEKTWRAAQDHCRQFRKDLASATNADENLALKQIISRSNLTSAWIGLFRDEWKWSDQSHSSFRNWAGGQPNNDGECVLYSAPTGTFWDRSCSQKTPFFCYGKKTKQKITKQLFRMEMRLPGDFDDFAVSEAILKELQAKYEGVKFQWKVQPDGKIFHKKNKKKK